MQLKVIYSVSDLLFLYFCLFLVDIFLVYITYNLLSFKLKFCQYLSISLRLECEYNHRFLFCYNDSVRGHEDINSFHHH